MPSVKAADPTGLSTAELERMQNVEVENSEEIEMKGVKLAVEYMELHWTKLTASRTPAELVLSESVEQDEELRQCFRTHFPTMDIR
eukprot:SAG31_NODE_45473_length_258_cov_1.603774_1_plen_85_part_11